MRRTLFAAILILSGAAAAQPAPEPAAPEPAAPEPAAPAPGVQPDNLRLYDGLTMDELEAIMKEAGIEYTRVPDAGGEAINAKSADALNYSYFLVDCPAEGEKRCASLNLVSYYFLETPKVTLKGLNAWNRDTWGARGVLYKDGTSAVVGNYALNGGVTARWVVNRIGNFTVELKRFSDFVGGAAPPP